MALNLEPDSRPVYHGHSPGVPLPFALCVDGFPERDYLPGALDDDIVIVWGLAFQDEVVCYTRDPDTGATHHCTLPSVEEAREYFGQLHDHDLRVVWL